jgi:RNA polymerase-binding transcription factor DksA
MKDLIYFKKRLQEEKAKIEEELAETSVKNTKNTDDWQAVQPSDKAVDRESDPIDAANNIEDYEGAFSVTDVLEGRLLDINKALEAMQKGNYGKCEVGGTIHEIGEDRLEANPAATECIEHTK